MKRALCAISTDRICTDETLQRYLCEFEAITPNHLLIGHQNDKNSFANPTLHIKGLQNHCKTVHSCAYMFSNYWRNYYLPALTIGTKRTDSKINLSKNDLFKIKLRDVPRSHWPLGKILNTYPDSDGLLRVVKIKTPNGKLIRSSRSICVLEKF